MGDAHLVAVMAHHVDLEARAAAAALDRLDAAKTNEGNVGSKYIGDLHCGSFRPWMARRCRKGNVNLNAR